MIRMRCCGTVWGAGCRLQHVGGCYTIAGYRAVRHLACGTGGHAAPAYIYNSMAPARCSPLLPPCSTLGRRRTTRCLGASRHTAVPQAACQTRRTAAAMRAPSSASEPASGPDGAEAEGPARRPGSCLWGKAHQSVASKAVTLSSTHLKARLAQDSTACMHACMLTVVGA